MFRESEWKGYNKAMLMKMSKFYFLLPKYLKAEVSSFRKYTNAEKKSFIYNCRVPTFRTVRQL